MKPEQFSLPFIAGLVSAYGVYRMWRNDDPSWKDLFVAAVCQAISFGVWLKVTV